MTYRVCFSQWSFYTVEADNEDDAIEIAEKEFVSDMRQPIANTTYDDVDAWVVGDRE